MEHLTGSGDTSQIICLVLALALALGFEFVNGFHDTANAVATVIYTHSLPPWVAVIWSGLCNLTGVLLSDGGVAFGILSLLPTQLVMDVGSSAGFAMVFSLLISAIIWNLGTWYLGLPASSSHSLIGSIMGVGMMNSLLTSGSFANGINWPKARESSQCPTPPPAFCRSKRNGPVPASEDATKTIVAFLKSDGTFSPEVYSALIERNNQIEKTLAGHKSLSELSQQERNAALKLDRSLGVIQAIANPVESVF